MSLRTDKAYGRRGGHWLPDNYTPPTRRPCEVCGDLMVCGQQKRHALCAGDPKVGTMCICPPDCTSHDSAALVGDGPRTCDPACVPCAAFAGQPHKDIWP